MPRKKKKKKSFLSLILLLIFVPILILLPLVSWYYVDQKEQQRQLELGKKLDALGELVSYTQRYRSVFYTRETKYLFQEKALLFTAEYDVQAGIDLAEGFDLLPQKEGVLLRLPAGRIFHVDADDKSLEEFMVKERFSVIDTGDYLPLISAERENIYQQAMDQDLPRLAEERAAVLIRALFHSAGIENLTIQFNREGPAAP